MENRLIFVGLGVWTRKPKPDRLVRSSLYEKNTLKIKNQDRHHAILGRSWSLYFICLTDWTIPNWTGVIFLLGVWTSLFPLHRLDHRQLLTLSVTLSLRWVRSSAEIRDLINKNPQNPLLVSSVFISSKTLTPNPMQFIFCTSIPIIPSTKSSPCDSSISHHPHSPVRKFPTSLQQFNLIEEIEISTEVYHHLLRLHLTLLYSRKV